MTQMPKNRSSSLRIKARGLASAENISYAEALRRLTEARTGVGAEPAVGESATNGWRQPGGLHKTTVEAPLGFAEFAAKGWPPRSKNILTGPLLAELLKLSDNDEFVVVDTAPDKAETESEATKGWLHANLGDQGYYRAGRQPGS